MSLVVDQRVLNAPFQEITFLICKFLLKLFHPVEITF